MSRRVCWGNPKGLSQRSHLFRRLAQQRSPLKRLRGKISGHLLRELLGHTVLQRHDQTALRPAGCSRRVRLSCLLWEDFKPCAATKISCCLSPTLQLMITPETFVLNGAAQNSGKARALHRFVSTVWRDPHSRWECREDFCTAVFICPPSQHHGYQSACAKVGPPHKRMNICSFGVQNQFTFTHKEVFCVFHRCHSYRISDGPPAKRCKKIVEFMDVILIKTAGQLKVKATNLLLCGAAHSSTLNKPAESICQRAGR